MLECRVCVVVVAVDCSCPLVVAMHWRGEGKKVQLLVGHLGVVGRRSLKVAVLGHCDFVVVVTVHSAFPSVVAMHWMGVERSAQLLVVRLGVVGMQWRIYCSLGVGL